MSGKDLTRLALCSVMLFATGLAGAQAPPPHPLFADPMPLELKITGPFGQLEDDDVQRPEYDAEIEFAGANGRKVTLDIEIRIRGNSRVTNCRYPPLRLDFPRGAVRGTVFAGQNELKLVTLCSPGDDYEDYLAKEFLIYRMWDSLSDRSFRVRWASVEYVYSDSRREKTVTAPAFLIEADWEVAERLGMETVEIERIAVGSLDAPHTALLGLFQYLIGNTDWAVIEGPKGEECCHNGKVIRNGDGPYIVLPYDFDNAGLINARYAVPAEGLPIRSVTQRLYRGFCAMNGEIEGAVARLNGERASLTAILDSEPLSERGRGRALAYLEGSFEIINDSRRLESQIYERCR